MLYQSVYIVSIGDSIIRGRSGQLLVHDGEYYSINPLRNNTVEIRYRLATMRDYNYHGVSHLAPDNCPD